MSGVSHRVGGSLRCREVVLKLLEFEASSNMADSKGCVPLHLAAWRGDVDIVRILLHHGPSQCRVNQQVSPPPPVTLLSSWDPLSPSRSPLLHHCQSNTISITTPLP